MRVVGGVRQHCLRWHARVQPVPTSRDKICGMASESCDAPQSRLLRVGAVVMGERDVYACLGQHLRRRDSSAPGKTLQPRGRPARAPARLAQLLRRSVAAAGAADVLSGGQLLRGGHEGGAGAPRGLDERTQRVCLGWAHAGVAANCVAARGQLRLVSSCGGQTHARRRCLPSPWGSRRRSSWLARARRCCATRRR